MNYDTGSLTLTIPVSKYLFPHINCPITISTTRINVDLQALEDAVKSVELDPSLPEGCLSAIKASIADANIQKVSHVIVDESLFPKKQKMKLPKE